MGHQLQQLSKERWDDLRPLITRLYLQQDLTLLNVSRTLRKAHGFAPTKRQLTRRLNEWGVRKNASRKRATFHGNARARNPSAAAIMISEDRSLRPSELPYSLDSPTLGKTSFDQSFTTKFPSPEPEQQEQSPPRSIPSNGPLPHENSLKTDTNQWSLNFMDQWPCDHATLDVVGSPRLTRLFAALKVEESDDIPLLVLPSTTLRSESIETQYITSCEILELQHKTHDVIDVFTHSDGEDLIHSAVLRSPNSVAKVSGLDEQSPWKQHGYDFDFPSGCYIYSSPFNEVYPFPLATPNFDQYYASRNTLASRYRAEYIQSKDSVLKLNGHLPKNHPILLAMLESQANACINLGRCQEAELLYQKLLALVQAGSGPHCKEALRLSCEIARLLSERGRSKQAEQLLREIQPKILGTFSSDDPLVLKLLYTKASIAAGKGDNVEEEAIYRERVQIRISTLGPRHTSTLEAIRSLVLPMIDLGKLAQSEQLLHSVLQIYNSDLSPHQYASDGPLRVAKLLCWAMRKQGKLKDSQSLCELGVTQAKLVLGPEHPSTLVLERELAQNLHVLGRFKESEQLFRKTLEQQIRLLGENDVECRNSIIGLAQLLTALKRHGEATELRLKHFRAVLDDCGPDNEFTYQGLKRLASSYDADGRVGETELMCERYLESLRELGEQGLLYIARVQKWMAARSRRSTFLGTSSPIMV